MRSNHRRSLIIKGIMVLLSLFVLAFALSYSWFTDKPKVEASGITASVESSGNDFEYAIGFATSQTGGDYKHTAFTNDVNADLNLEELYTSEDTYEEYPINLLYDYNPIDLTGNGVTLVRPAMNYGNWSINKASRNYSVAEENVQYITFDLIFRTTVSNTTIQLAEDSFAKGACENYSGDGRLTGAANDSDGISVFHYNNLTGNSVTSNKYGRFSTDAIVGAVRVAFLEYVNYGDSADTIVGTKQTEYASAPKLLWIPRPDIYLNNNPTGNSLREKETSGWQLDKNVARNTTFNLVSDSQTNASYSTYIHQYYNVFQVENNQTPAIVTYEDAVPSTLDTNAPAGTNKVTFGDTRDLVTLDHINDANNDDAPDDGYYYGKVRVRIWIEGTDSESRRALAGGKFSVSFHITG